VPLDLVRIGDALGKGADDLQIRRVGRFFQEPCPGLPRPVLSTRRLNSSMSGHSISSRSTSLGKMLHSNSSVLIGNVPGPPLVLPLINSERFLHTLARLTAQPAQKTTFQHRGIDPIRFGPAVFARYCHTGGMDDVSIYAAGPQPTRQVGGFARPPRRRHERCPAGRYLPR
jgi:hypothetical protein